ncbi:MAG: hypothetical protein HC892_11155 [Saprospiraceae bacterium]|nr:hypothetical protein [Saprospiraceae bacterium]
MRGYLLSFTLVALNCLFSIGYAQNIKLQRAIMATDTITDDGVTFTASSDDAEQENDAIDALFDDDIDAGWEGEPDDQNIFNCWIALPQYHHSSRRKNRFCIHCCLFP